MRIRRSTKLYAPSRVFIVILLLLIGSFFVPIKPVLGMEGSIWTTDPQGEQVNGNVYIDPRNVYLAGGPQKGSLGLTPGFYYFQVTDSTGKTLLSIDGVDQRRFEVGESGSIVEYFGEHDWNLQNDGSILIQLWPFQPSANSEYKVWVTMEDDYLSFGFVPSLSKTDNFKVIEVSKYFELWVTEGIYRLQDVSFYVNYTIADPITGEPAFPWIQEQLLYDRNETIHKVYRYEAKVFIGTSIYWKFFLLNTNGILWSSEYGPEEINIAGMVNKETLFLISGHVYSYPDEVGLPGWNIELWRDNKKAEETPTDSDGYFEFIGYVGDVPGNYKVNTTGWDFDSEVWYEFIADGTDQTCDFYDYKMIEMTNLKDVEIQRFDIIFTPSKEDPSLYKFSSTNPGSFFIKVVKIGDPGTPVNMEIILPDFNANSEFDSPNFQLHHIIRGKTSYVDVKIYKGSLESKTAEITDLFNITASADGKNLIILGKIPQDADAILVKVHVDYQIDGLLSEWQVDSIQDYRYDFIVKIYGSVHGGRKSVHGGRK